ncbi:hypothetical protein OU798_06805 [Prolixibacteraceae bacterium Z1-6]|uniref:Outer membrane protein beta-barrel domain-containing protein n=1 Tax=Draconibacterium aestuarii TaxID=2998507 RepID=A0A9X3J449_9BACT|nr:hypothetical protein [Prolixibacteraceae bacterium Z1-6]
MSNTKLLSLMVLLLLGGRLFAQESINTTPTTFKREVENPVFMPKGQWMTGGTFSYKQFNQNDFHFLVLDNWNGQNYNFKVTPYFMYAVKDNTGLGGKFSYRRNLKRIESMQIVIDKTIIDIKATEVLSHMFYGTAFLRSYLGLGDSKRFGLFVDTELTYGMGQGRSKKGLNEEITGTYQTTKEFEIGVVPGLVAFINDYVALEVSVNVLGLNFKKTDQEFNRVDHGSFTSVNTDFKLNLLTLNFGVSIYF